MVVARYIVREAVEAYPLLRYPVYYKPRVEARVGVVAEPEYRPV